MVMVPAQTLYVCHCSAFKLVYLNYYTIVHYYCCCYFEPSPKFISKAEKISSNCTYCMYESAQLFGVMF